MMKCRQRNGMLRTIAILLLIAFISSNLAAQKDSTQLLKLDEAIASALNNNRSVLLAKEDEQIAQSKYKQTDAIHLPQIGISYNAMTTNNPLNAFGFKLQQRTIGAADFNPDVLNHPNGTPDFSTKIDLQQPLINPDMEYMRKAAAKQKELYAYKTERTKEFIAFEVKKAYLQLQLTYQSVKVMEEALATAKQMNKFTNDYFNQGLVQKSEVLNTQVYVASMETNLSKAKTNVANASDYLSLLMGKGMGQVYQVSDISLVSINESAKLSDNRSDFMAMQKALEATDLMIQSSKMAAYPKLNAFASYQLNDASMLGFGANAYLAGIQLSWSIFSGNRNKNTIATQKLERNKLADELTQQKEQSNLELNKTLRDIADAKKEINKYQSSVDQSKERLRILQNRYEQGLVNTTDLMTATTQVSQQKLAMSQSQFNLNLSQAYLQFIISSTTKTK